MEYISEGVNNRRPVESGQIRVLCSGYGSGGSVGDEAVVGDLGEGASVETRWSWRGGVSLIANSWGRERLATRSAN